MYIGKKDGFITNRCFFQSEELKSSLFKNVSANSF
jgi:hypothetical protein